MPRSETHSPAGLRIHLLGGFAVVVGSRRVEDSAWRLRKAKALIKLLALALDHRLHREQVIDALWSDLDPEAAGNNLRQTLHSARRTLGLVSETDRATEWIASRDQVLSLDPIPWVDVIAFERASLAALDARTADAYESAARLYTGDLLPEDRYEQWTLERRDALRHRYRTVLMELARFHAAADAARAAATLQRVLEIEPAHEEAHLELMRLYVLSGRRHDALQQYRLLEGALRRELDAAPSEEATQLYEAIRAGRPPAPTARIDAVAGSLPSLGGHGQTVPPRVLGAHTEPRAVLPGAVTSFIGREKELDELTGHVQQTRLIVLLGPAGFGKTRLALELARRSAGSFHGDVWYADLATLQDPALVPQTVASAIGLRQQPVDPVASVSERVRDGRALLVLDNCEHLPGACASLADRLLRSCPGLHIVATSREQLNAPGEVLYRVAPLAVPLVQTPVEDLGSFESVRLFVERARAVRSGFDLTPHNAPAIAEICRRLDGMPLAIELAAARIRHLPADQILDRLSDRFLLLRGPRAGPARHRTLEAAVGWSYDLLNDHERALFDRLAVFAGTATLEAVEVICTGEGIEAPAVLGILSDLIDKSLVVVEEDRSGRVRYHLLETLRAYGRRHLQQGGGAGPISRRLCDYLTLLAQQTGQDARTGLRTRWLDRLEAEHDNLRAALEWALTGRDPVRAVSLAAAMGPYWRARHPTEGREWLARVLVFGEEIPEAHRLPALLWVTELTMFQDDYELAGTFGQEAVDLAAKLHDHTARALAMAMLGHALWHRRETVRGVELCRQSLILAEGVGDHWARRSLLHHCARVAWHESDYPQTALLAGQLLDVSRDAGDETNIIEALALLGESARSQRDYRRAAALFGDALGRARASGDQFRIATLQPRLADVLRILGDSKQARALYLDSVVGLYRLGEKWFLMRSMVGLARVSIGSDPERAVRLLGAAQALRDGLGALPDQANFDRAVGAVRDALPAARFESAWADGHAMDLARAVAYASADPSLGDNWRGPEAPLTPD